MTTIGRGVHTVKISPYLQWRVRMNEGRKKWNWLCMTFFEEKMEIFWFNLKNRHWIFYWILQYLMEVPYEREGHWSLRIPSHIVVETKNVEENDTYHYRPYHLKLNNGEKRRKEAESGTDGRLSVERTEGHWVILSPLSEWEYYLQLESSLPFTHRIIEWDGRCCEGRTLSLLFSLFDVWTITKDNVN